jgi:beta-N-acetylhexosaminidase
MDLRARAAQLIVLGGPLREPVAAQAASVRELGVGGVLLTGRSSAGVDGVAARTAALQKAVPAGHPGLLVAADQEGGLVQTLSGPGFSSIPSASVQSTWPAARLATAATGWGDELRRAGVNLDLAPVSDVLSARLGNANLSVGVSHRSFGTHPGAVSDSVVAVVDGLARSGVAATAKHFPGLGQVGPNTDFTRTVRDTTTGVDSAWLDPFRSAIDAGVPLVMVSSATYTRIDPAGPAAFSREVIGGLLRGRLRFSGVVISDDLGAAAAVADVPVAERAVRFVAAGGDLVLTVDPATARPMVDGLVMRAGEDPAFASVVGAAARRVLTEKDRLGLLRC